MNTGNAIFISAILASVGWYVTTRSQQVMDRRRHTYKVFQDYRNDKYHIASLRHAFQLVKDKKVPDSTEETDREDLDKILYVLNHYEFVAAAIFNGDVDEGFFKSCEYTTISTLPICLNDFIQKRRDYKKQKTAFKNLEDLSARWGKKSISHGEYIYEFFMLRPCRKLPGWLKRIDQVIEWSESRKLRRKSNSN